MRTIIVLSIILLNSITLKGHEKDTLIFKGQLSSWLNYNNTYDDLSFGGRYVPQLSFNKYFSEKHLLDLEASMNMYGNRIGKSDADEDLKPYRAWVRYSNSQFELRCGLQKINFGSATMFRPLMWFDQMNPTDPLKLTDGVWGLLGRYYFLNNANIWLWGLYGNEEPKGWEYLGTEKGEPEFGGRVQLPVFVGEAAISYHHRSSYFQSFLHDYFWMDYRNIPDNKIGFDTKIDWVVGLWVEGSRNWFGKDLELITNQTLVNIGADYTFGIGSGLLAIYEHLFIHNDKEILGRKKDYQFSMLSLSYNLGIFDHISAMAYYNWDMSEFYTFLNWQRTYNRISLHLMAYWNPDILFVPNYNSYSTFFGGKGVQFMFVFNH